MNLTMNSLVALVVIHCQGSRVPICSTESGETTCLMVAMATMNWMVERVQTICWVASVWTRSMAAMDLIFYAVETMPIRSWEVLQATKCLGTTGMTSSLDKVAGIVCSVAPETI